MLLHEAIKRARSRSGASQKAASEAASISVTQYQNYEYGKSEPTATVLIALAEYFGVSMDYLVGRTDDPGTH